MTSRWLVSSALGAAVLVLTGCGGDDDIVATSSPPPAPPASSASAAVPTSAGASADAFIAYLALQSTMTSETAEPLDVSTFSAAATLTETAEPVAIGS